MLGRQNGSSATAKSRCNPPPCENNTMIKLIKLTALAAVLLTTLTGCATPFPERVSNCQRENGYDVQTCMAMVQYEQQQAQASAQALMDMGNQIRAQSAAQQQATLQALQSSMPKTTQCHESFGTLRCTTY